MTSFHRSVWFFSDSRAWSASGRTCVTTSRGVTLYIPFRRSLRTRSSNRLVWLVSTATHIVRVSTWSRGKWGAPKACKKGPDRVFTSTSFSSVADTFACSLMACSCATSSADLVPFAFLYAFLASSSCFWASAWPSAPAGSNADVKSSTSSTVWCGSSSYSNFKATSADTSFCSSEMNAKICSRPASVTFWIFNCGKYCVMACFCLVRFS
mmetsp:Transcript_43772/g.73857  ORF Transcript_43772/g.73857 Transcript_43772/m.73857 type:complete len:210 (+) Transcript_43772:2022-2651(+)